MVIFSASDCSSPLLTLSWLGIVCTESYTIAAKCFQFVEAFFLPVLLKWMNIWPIDWPLFCVWHILFLQPESKLPLQEIFCPRCDLHWESPGADFQRRVTPAIPQGLINSNLYNSTF